MLRLVLAAVAIHHHRRGAFLERLSERIHTSHRNGDGLHDARTSTLLRIGFVGRQELGHRHTLPGGIFKA